MRRPRLFTTLAAAALAAITGLSGASPAAAITGGTEDTQNRYSTVGMIVFYDGTGGRFPHDRISDAVVCGWASVQLVEGGLDQRASRSGHVA